MTNLIVGAVAAVITSVIAAVAAFLIDKQEKVTPYDIPPRWILELAQTEILLSRAGRMLDNVSLHASTGNHLQTTNR